MYNNTVTKDAVNVSTTHQIEKQDEGVPFRMRMICKNTKLLPCYKKSKGWMVPITMLQQVPVSFQFRKTFYVLKITTTCNRLFKSNLLC